MMHGHEKSDSVIVAAKPANKVARPAVEQSAAEPAIAEPVEPRAETKGNADQQSTCRAQSRVSVSQALERIRKVARERKKERFTTLFHHISIDLLEEAFYELKEDAAPGVDRLTWTDYEADLECKLEDLHDRVQRGAYRALPSRRVYIPKPDGRQRPLAVAALEDKIVQRAVVALLNAIYEEDFLGFSYGFRPGRGTHDALDALCVGIHSRKVSWILDADIRSFFDTVSQEWLIRFVEHRIGDRRIIRLIRKWLKAGVLEDGIVAVSEKGTGQGAVISPLLANIYLHYALDLWAMRWRRREATGDMIIVRYADDFIIGFQHEADARRFLDEMRERLGKFALSLHPEKTRLIEFGRFAAERRKRRGLGKPETFNFLGFTFICGKTRQDKFQIKRKTRRDRMRAKLKMIKEEMWRRMHQPIPEQGKWLGRVVSGYFDYHAVPTNGRALAVFGHHVTDLWRHTLRRRSQKDRITWAQMTQLVNAWLPKPIILHPWPSARFAVTHPRWEPYAGKPHARFCAGGGAMKSASLPLLKRPNFIGLFGGMAAAWSLATNAEELPPRETTPSNATLPQIEMARVKPADRMTANPRLSDGVISLMKDSASPASMVLVALGESHCVRRRLSRSATGNGEISGYMKRCHRACLIRRRLAIRADAPWLVPSTASCKPLRRLATARCSMSFMVALAGLQSMLREKAARWSAERPAKKKAPHSGRGLRLME
jgi:RNA-directed DNA polymerase